MLIDLVQLRTFVAVAEEQHLTRASERLHISQSAASAHVRAVEDCLDTKLFVRTNRSLELTRDGEVLLEHARTLLNEAAQFQTLARELNGQAKGTLVVGTSSEPLSSRIGDVVAALRTSHPLISVDLRARPSSGTRQALMTGELDVGVMLGQPIDPGFTYYQLATVKFKVVGPIAWKDQIENASWPELANMPWITPTASSHAYSSMLAKLFTEKGLEPNTVVTFDNINLARALLHSGVGMMLMREEYALEGLNNGHFAISPLADAESHLYISHLASREKDPLICAFIDAVKVAWPEMIRH